MRKPSSLSDVPGLSGRFDTGEIDDDYIDVGNRITDDEIARLARSLAVKSPESVDAFMDASADISSTLTREEFKQWAGFWEKNNGRKNLIPDLVSRYFRLSPIVARSGSFHLLKTWGEMCLKVADQSTEAAKEFFKITPEIVSGGEILNLSKWVKCALDLLGTNEHGHDAAIAFMQSSSGMLDAMPFNELIPWGNLGLKLSRQSSDLGRAFFRSAPDDIDLLYRSERSIIFELAKKQVPDTPDDAVEFFHASPSLLAHINPNLRLDVLQFVQKTYSVDESGEKPLVILDRTVSALRTLSNPDQETAMIEAKNIAEESLHVAAVFIEKISALLDRISPDFLSYFVETGMSLFEVNEEKALQYFAHISAESEKEISRWESAVFLDDHKYALQIIAQAMAGKALKLKSTEDLTPDDNGERKNYPTTDGVHIYLPPFMDGFKSARENYLVLKIAIAHQAGLIEFGTFSGAFKNIIGKLRSFDLPELALDIFYILEDGRIDFLLKEKYRGLAKDMTDILPSIMDMRSNPSELPPMEAGVEMLLRLSSGLSLDDSGPFSDQARFLENSIDGFYLEASSIRDCFEKTVEIYDYLSSLEATGPYQPMIDLITRGRIEPDLVSGPGPYADSIPTGLGDEEGTDGQPLIGLMMTPEELAEYLKNIKDLTLLKNNDAAELPSQGLYLADPDGTLANGAKNLPEGERCAVMDGPIISIPANNAGSHGPYYYDEWDFLQKAYRRKWCTLREKSVPGTHQGLVESIYASHSDLIRKVRQQFQRIRPEALETMKRVEWGDGIDLTAMIEGVVDRKSGSTPSEKIFIRKERRIRQVSTMLLLDMSASTGEIVGAENGHGYGNEGRKIIDIEIESLVVMMEALDALDDEYAIFGFSGYGRDQVDYYRIKDFSDPYSEAVKQRIGGISPKQSTRMGPAIRHSTARLKSLESDQKLLILISDGFPQDHDYGEDRRSRQYGLNDTMMALIEAKREGIQPFCITVDQAGNDYLKQMCDPSGYMVIRNIEAMPEIIPKVVESLLG